MSPSRGFHKVLDHIVADSRSKLTSCTLAEVFETCMPLITGLKNKTSFFTTMDTKKHKIFKSYGTWKYVHQQTPHLPCFQRRKFFRFWVKSIQINSTIPFAFFQIVDVWFLWFVVFISFQVSQQSWWKVPTVNNDWKDAISLAKKNRRA